MEEHEATFLANNIYKALRPGFLALINAIMRVGIQLGPDRNAYPDLEFQRQAEALLLAAEQYEKGI